MRWRRRLLRRQRKAVERRLAKEAANNPFARFLGRNKNLLPPNSTCELVATGFISREMRDSAHGRVARYFAQKHDEEVQRRLEDRAKMPHTSESLLYGWWTPTPMRQPEPIDVETALAPKRPKPGGSGRVR